MGLPTYRSVPWGRSLFEEEKTMDITIDNDGFLADPSDWNEEVAFELAKREEFDLTA